MEPSCTVRRQEALPGPRSRKQPNLDNSSNIVIVTLALGVAAFCLIALFGLLPLGIQTNQSSTSQTAAASALSSVFADLRATPKTSLTSPQYDITFGTAKFLYFDGEGRAVTPTDPNATPSYRVTITFPASPVGDDTAGDPLTGTTTTMIEYSGGWAVGLENIDPARPSPSPSIPSPFPPPRRLLICRPLPLPRYPPTRC